jgi:ribonuclease J
LLGLVEPEAAEEAVPFLRTAVERALAELPAGARRDDDVVGEAARRALRRALNERFGKRPLTEIQVVRL